MNGPPTSTALSLHSVKVLLEFTDQTTRNGRRDYESIPASVSCNGHICSIYVLLAIIKLQMKSAGQELNMLTNCRAD